MKRRLVLCALLALMIPCAASGADPTSQVETRGTTELVGGQLWVKADSYDSAGVLNLENDTPQPDGYKPLLPAINWWANGHRIWSTAFDVGPNYDFAPLYHRDQDNPADSQDVIYATNEKYPKVGIMVGPTAKAQLQVVSFPADRPALIADKNNASPEGWNTQFTTRGYPVAGVWNDGSIVVHGASRVAPLTVWGQAAAYGFRSLSAYDDFVTGLRDPYIYGTSSAGTGLFSQAGNLVIQPRDLPDRSVVIAAGSPPRPVVTVQSSGKLRLGDTAGGSGGELYVENGALKFRGGAGTVTTVAGP